MPRLAAARIQRAGRVVERDLGALVFVERHRHQRRAASRAVLAGVEAFTTQGVGDKGFSFVVLTPHASGVQAMADASGALDSSATARKAWCSCVGSSFPRFSARRSIPAHAVELKKNRRGIEPVSSTCDNEHTSASLGHSEILGVEYAPRDCSLGAKHITSVRPFTPWRDERIIFAGKASKEAAEGVILGIEHSGDVLPENDAWLEPVVGAADVDGIGDLAEGQGQIAASIVKRLAQAGDGKGLTGRAPAEHVRGFNLPHDDPLRQVRHVAEVRHVMVVVRENRAGEWLDLREPGRSPPDVVPGDRCSLYTAANRTEFHLALSKESP